LSTDFPDKEQVPSSWISQAEAARIHGVTRQAINKLVRGGRLRSLKIGGHVLVNREDVEGFRPQPSGRPAAEDMRDFERIKTLLETCNETTIDRLYEHLRSRRPRHPIEARLGADSEVILEALNRAGELTTRMFRGVIAEAAFDVHVVNALAGWRSEPIAGNPPFDFQMDDGIGRVRVQVKLQRSAKGTPITRSGYYVVETQRTRGGKKRGGEGIDERTRPYRYGEFDILAVCLQPSTGRWDEFRYTVGNWLQPQDDGRITIATYQPVSPGPNDDWSNDFLTCVGWLRGSEAKTIRGQLGGSSDRGIERQRS
jgi:excisionase family DNA binding protein